VDIYALSTVETLTVELRHPTTGAPLMEGDKTVSITLKGMHTDAWGDEVRRQSEADEKRKKSAAESRRDAARLYACVTVAWSGITKGAKEVECTPEEARKLYEPESAAWLRSQVSAALLAHAEGIKK
jgi:hypothetical protein